MKTIKTIKKTFVQKMSMLMATLLFSLYSIAQETKKVDVSIDTDADGGGNFFAQPWVWIVGGAVFLLLLVALLRNNSSRD